MERLDVFSLAAHAGPYESWPLETPLLRDGVATGVLVRGYVIEAQYRCGERFLLVTSWDCPYEEAQEIQLLGPDLRVLSRRSVGAPYCTVLVYGHEPLDAHTLLLHCGPGLDVRVRVRERRPLGVGPLVDVELVEL
jgi:hypothetical protein